MYTQTQIEVIKRFGKKELSEGCVIIYRIDDDFDGDGHICKLTQPSEFDDDGVYCIYPRTPYGQTDYVDLNDKDDLAIEILGQIPHLEDVFRIAEEKDLLLQVGDTSGIHIGISLRGNDMKIRRIIFRKSLPLIEQPDDTLQELLSLFPNP